MVLVTTNSGYHAKAFALYNKFSISQINDEASMSESHCYKKYNTVSVLK